MWLGMAKGILNKPKHEYKCEKKYNGSLRDKTRVLIDTGGKNDL